jgi:hypothetical protein
MRPSIREQRFLKPSRQSCLRHQPRGQLPLENALEGKRPTNRYITEAVAHYPCSTNRWIMLNGVDRLPGGETATNTLPWHIRYVTFQGTLPTITGIEVSIVDYAYLVEASGVSCLYKSTAARPVRGILRLNGEGRVSSFRFNELFQIPKFSGSFLCGPEIGFWGEAFVGTQTTWAGISVRLVS